jgi:hypothetical protein
MKTVAAVAFAVCGMFAAAHPVAAEVHALVIGINKYATKQELRGSVGDAADIAGVLGRDGVADLDLLTDGEATKAAFDGAWSGIVGRVKAGDVLFLAFSGHGIRVPEKAGKHETPDGYEKGFLLQPYDEASAPDEILRDEDLYDLFAAATAKGAKIVFVADACHAGAAVRGLDPRGSGAPFRFQRFQTQAAPVAEAAVDAVKARPANPGVTILSATDQRLSIQEVLVDGTYRGALSYAVARGLEGSASNDAGEVTAEALHAFVSPLVRALSGNRQIPQFTLPEPELELVAAKQTADNGFGVLPTVPVAVIGALPDGFAVDGATLTSDRSGAELIWDNERRQLIDGSGDVLASGLEASGLQGAIDARRVLDALRGAMAHQSGQVATTATAEGAGSGAGSFFTHGMTARFDLHPGDFTYLAIADLNATGTVQFMYPLTERGEAAEVSANSPVSFTAPVTQPYGADFIVTFAGRQPLTDLVVALRKAHDTVAPIALYEAVRAARAKDEVRVGIDGVYSCESLRSNGQCDSMLASSP